MASNGGGIGRFARRQTDATTKAPAPVPPPAASNAETQEPSPNNDFGSYDGGAAMESSSFDNVGMFGGSFDMSFDADKASYDYNDYGSFSMSEQPEENVLGSNDSAVAVAPSANTQSTIPSQESLANTPVTANKSAGGGPFQFRASQAQGASPPRPKTAAPPQPSAGNKSGLSMFASRKTAATNQEPSTTATTMEKTPVSSRPTVNHGQSTGAPPPPPPPAAAITVEETTPTTTNTNGSASTFTRVIPPPSIAPSKPLPTQMGLSSVPSATPKGPSINTTARGFPSLVSQQQDFATPLPPPRNNTTLDTTMIQKTGNNMTSTFITPEAPTNNNNGATLPDLAMEEAFLGELAADKGTDSFDDLLSLFLADLRSTTDIEMRGQAELLELEVDLSRAYARTLQDRSDAVDLLDGISSCIESVDDWCC